jgi:hypothetical protein
MYPDIDLMPDSMQDSNIQLWPGTGGGYGRER